MTVRDIIKKFLKERGFSGLCREDCGCRLDDLIPCSTDFSECKPGYIVACDPDKDDMEHNWKIVADSENDLKTVSESLRFIDHGETVTDTLTGLMWAKNANLPGKELTWHEAMEFCKNLDLAGYKDWGLPTKKELLSLADDMRFAPMLPAGHPFYGVVYGWHWSSTTDALDHDYALVVIFGYGNGGDHKSRRNYVWPVRGGVSR